MTAAVLILIVALSLPALALAVVATSFALDWWLDHPIARTGFESFPNAGVRIELYDQDADDALSPNLSRPGPAVSPT